MFKYIFAITFFASFVACKSDSVPETKVDSLVSPNIDRLVLNTTFDIQKLKGIYHGSFDGTPISISINYANGINISGYNIHKGLKRNMRGNLEPFGSQFKLVLDEPGTNKYDGHFELFIDTATFEGKGSWQPKNDQSLKKKDFTFVKDKTEGYNQLASSWTDSLGRIMTMNVDGSAQFAYYTGKGTPQEQLQNIAGNWQDQKDSVIVFWQPNTIFPSRRSAFFVKREKYEGDSTIYVQGLLGENMEWVNEAP